MIKFLVNNVVQKTGAEFCRQNKLNYGSFRVAVKRAKNKKQTAFGFCGFRIEILYLNKNRKIIWKR